MIDLGFYTLYGSFAVAVVALLLAIGAFHTRREDLFAAARNAVVVCGFFTTLTSLAIVYAFLIGDFQMEYVWANSDRDMPIFYKLGALWGGQSGSLLFWGWILVGYSTLVVLRNRNASLRLMAPTIATLMFVAAFFLGLVAFGSSPFDRAAFVPPDGVGLNPLLQHPAMVIHPPSLYLGMIGFTVPFAFAIGALVSGELGNDWLKKARPWALTAWLFLGAGNILGGWWAYLELGWGGYWAWDPVENAAFMPWLAGTAYIHSAMVQERKGMLKVWNMVLVLTTFLLTIFGTFITRSGMVSSVHSFAQSSIGYWFAGFLVFSIVISAGLLVFRSRELRSDRNLDSVFSRESMFLLNNLILLGGAFAVLWGTVFPMVTEMTRGVRVSVGPPFFNQIMIPIGLALLFIMGVGPLIPWRRANWRALGRIFSLPVGLGVAAAAILFFLGVSHAYALVTFSLCVFVLITIVAEFRKGIAARVSSSGENPFTAFFHLFSKGQRRYGGYVVHLGVVIIFIGFAGAAFTRDAEQTLDPGESMEFLDYELTYRGLHLRQDARVKSITADVVLTRDGENLALMSPQKNWFMKSEQMASEVAIHSTWGSDLYLILASFDQETERASLKVYLNPLVRWYWLGGIVMCLGGALVLLPMGRRKIAAAARSSERAA